MLQTHTIDFNKFRLGEINLSMVRMLITTEEELTDFEENFWKDEPTQFFAITRYRLHRIKQNNMSFPMFNTLYTFNSHQAMEALFMLPIDKEITNAIESKIAIGALTLRDIYAKFSEDNLINPTRFAHNRRQIVKNRK